MFHKKVVLNDNFPVLQIEFDNDIIEFAKRQAEIKAKYTSDADQNGDDREQSVKVCKQLSGCLSEIAVEYFLKLMSFKKAKEGQLVRIVRYDDIRSDGYQSAEDEYDIRILSIKPNEKYDISVRSSINFKTDLNGITNLNIIGPYTNKVKLHETPSDFYIQPIFQLKKPNPNLKVSDINFCDMFDKGLFDLYIVGGCTRAMMQKSENYHSLGQIDTNYRVLQIGKGSNFEVLSQQLSDAISNWFVATEKKLETSQFNNDDILEQVTQILNKQVTCTHAGCTKVLTKGVIDYCHNNLKGAMLCMEHQ